HPAADRLATPLAGDPAYWRGGDAVSVPELVRRHVIATPDAPAVIAGDTVLSYGALGDRVGALAALLRSAGEPAGTRVGLLVDHGADLVAAIVATLAVGATYVPLDPRYPAPRLRAMVAQAGVATVLTTADHRAAAEAFAPVVLDLAEAPPGAGFPPPAAPDAPGYVLHTSGSTGAPKGVAQWQRNTLHQLRLHTENLRLTAADRLSVATSFGFDMAVTDTFAALVNGACAVLVDVRALGLAGLADALRRHRVSVYHSTPTVFRYLADHLAGTSEPVLPDLRAVVLGGEAVTGEDLERCRRHLPAHGVLVNGYGATEISFAVQDHLPVAATPPRSGVLPIGSPLAGMRVGLLAADGSAAALAGELVISSEYLATYWEGAPADLARFDVDADGVRRYRTGDLARRLPDGRLVHLGRTDRQVKIRGHRVEPADVEAALTALPGVAHAAVVADRARGEHVLRAFVTLADATARVTAGGIRDALTAAVPDHLVPASVTVLGELPLTPTGKIDARALLDLAAAAPDPAASPSTATDGPVAVITAAWAEALGAPVRPDDRFFDVGGHSLLAARVHHQLVERLGVTFPLTALYAHPTAALLAAHLD
ncbi:MAG TPA: non-ribosomal peptide synthetase, partial [Pseudonocardiaceae bacterium]